MRTFLFSLNFIPGTGLTDAQKNQVKKITVKVQKHCLIEFSCFLSVIFYACQSSPPSQSSKKTETEICVYGGTASGIMAAVAASREGAKVTIIEPSRWLGGMTGGGISEIDWGREEAVGGSSLAILSHKYNNYEYRETFKYLLREYSIDVLYEHRISSVTKDGKSIRSIILDYAPPDSLGVPLAQAVTVNAAEIIAEIFIDCSYEGDLMALSGISYTYGRESKEQYDESLAGVRPNLLIYDIDPYIMPGDSTSGLLPFLQDRDIGPLGSADKLVMGYCLRYKLDMDGTGIEIPLPDNYDPAQFELFRRGFLKGLDLIRSVRMRRLNKISEKKEPYLFNRSGTGNTNRSLLTTTIYGCNDAYPDGDWTSRSRIWKFHQDYFKGLIHFIKTDSVAPGHLKKIVANITFQQGVFDDTRGWPHQLYIREGRRMISDYVLTQKDLEGQTDPPHSVGLASYGVDDWPYATIAVEGKVALSGGEFSILYLDDRHNGIYKIPYESIIPREGECENLIVPVCLSASHIAMTSIRMEPVYMILGESAGISAAMALNDSIPVQKVNYADLRTRLLAIGQKLERPM